MKIATIEAIPYALPTVRPHRWQRVRDRLPIVAIFTRELLPSRPIVSHEVVDMPGAVKSLPRLLQSCLIPAIAVAL